MVYKNLFMTLENLTLDTFRYCLCSLHNDMWGSYERCSRQNHGEGGEGKQAKSVQHLNFFNVIHSHPLNSSMSLFYFVPPWLQISTLTLFLLPQHQLCRRRHLNTITQFDPCFPLVHHILAYTHLDLILSAITEISQRIPLNSLSSASTRPAIPVASSPPQ